MFFVSGLYCLLQQKKCFNFIFIALLKSIYQNNGFIASKFIVYRDTKNLKFKGLYGCDFEVNV